MYVQKLLYGYYFGALAPVKEKTINKKGPVVSRALVSAIAITPFSIL